MSPFFDPLIPDTSCRSALYQLIEPDLKPNSVPLVLPISLYLDQLSYNPFPGESDWLWLLLAVAFVYDADIPLQCCYKIRNWTRLAVCVMASSNPLRFPRYVAVLSALWPSRVAVLAPFGTKNGL